MGPGRKSGSMLAWVDWNDLDLAKKKCVGHHVVSRKDLRVHYRSALEQYVGEK